MDKDWTDTHCYGCGEEFERAISSLSDEELEDPTINAEHSECLV